MAWFTALVVLYLTTAHLLVPALIFYDVEDRPNNDALWTIFAIVFGFNAAIAWLLWRGPKESTRRAAFVEP